MAPLLSPPEVGEKIVEWHSCIITRDVKQSRKLKEEVESKIERMQADDKMLAYYQLIAHRHQILTEALHQESPLPTIYHGKAATDDYLRFMYYYVSGQSEFFYGRSKSAIRSYKIAERLVENVNDPAEKAEFYERIGINYYQIDQYTFAASYMEQALEFFEKNKIYIERELNCKAVLAMIDTEIECYDSAERVYDEILATSRPYPMTHGNILRNIGLNRRTQGKFHEAISFFKEALVIKEHYHSINGLKTRFNLIHSQLRAGIYTSGLEEVEREIHAHQLTNYAARCLISRGLYLENDYSLVEDGIQQLKDNELFYDCSDVSEEIATYYGLKEDFQTAFHYMKLAHSMRRKHTNLGVDQS